MTSNHCNVPARFGYMNLAGGLSEVGLPFDQIGKGEVPTLHLSRMEFCDPAATVALAAFAATSYRATKRPIVLEGWNAESYLARVGLKEFAGYKDDYPKRRQDTDRITNLIEVADSKDRQEARKNVLNVLQVNHDGARSVLDYCLEEMLRNVDDHAESPVNALLQAQYYENRHEVVMAIADTGYGILRSLRQWHQNLDSDFDAVKAAMQPGVSGRNTKKGTNAGLGLTVSSRLITRMGGTFQLVTGSAALEVKSKTEEIRALRVPWQGVIVTMIVPRNDDLDWEGTFTEVMGEI